MSHFGTCAHASTAAERMRGERQRRGLKVDELSRADGRFGGFFDLTPSVDRQFDSLPTSNERVMRAMCGAVRYSGFHVARRYCPRCGSPLTTESDAAPDLMFVKAGGIDANQ